MIRLDPASISSEDITRFWARVDTNPEVGECWCWRTGKRGYFYWRDPDGKRCRLYCSILAYLLTHPGIPDGHIVTRSCNNANCLNPAHLQAMTRKQLCRRNVDTGRRTYAHTPWLRQVGQDNSRALLTNDQVKVIRRRYRSGERVALLAQEFAVTSSTVHSLIAGRTWKDLPDD